MTGWVSTPDLDISFQHCGRPAYWEGEDVFCSKCNVRMTDRCDICDNEMDLCGGHIGGEYTTLKSPSERRVNDVNTPHPFDTLSNGL